MTYGFTPNARNPDLLDWSDDGTHYIDYDSRSGYDTMDTATAMGLINDWFKWDSATNKLRYKQPGLYVPQDGWALAQDGKSCWIYPAGYRGVQLVYKDVAAAIKRLQGL